MARTKLRGFDWYNRQGWVGEEPETPTKEFTIVGDRVEQTKTVVVHRFSVGDVEDPDIYAAHPLIEWEKSEKGRWVMANALETPTWHRQADPMSYGYVYQIRARLRGAALTEWLLRYGDR